MNKRTIRSTSLYPPIEKKWAEFEKMMNEAGKEANYNWHTNLLYAHRFGVPEDAIEQYKREHSITKEEK